MGKRLKIPRSNTALGENTAGAVFKVPEATSSSKKVPKLQQILARVNCL